MPRSKDDPAPVRRFLLAGDPEAGPPTLAQGEARHALRVLRLGPGDRLWGLDGRGASWPLEVVAVGRERLELARRGPPEREPEPGTAGARAEWVELAVSLPRGARAAAMVERVVQLGLSRLLPLVTERTASHARGAGGARRERLERAVGEAMKQCGRLWPTRIEAPLPLAEAVVFPDGARVVVLDGADAAPALSSVLAAGRGAGPWTRPAPLLLFVGPEGGFTDDERALLASAGAEPACLAPATLRTETAAEAALAVAAQAALAATP
ncbi:MAG: RsmE family RNA methyltransferase [Planctomycetota bacterium]|nr:RsmE family RNA methyltransferase [Planctomycetota bacterium]